VKQDPRRGQRVVERRPIEIDPACLPQARPADHARHSHTASAARSASAKASPRSLNVICTMKATNRTCPSAKARIESALISHDALRRAAENAHAATSDAACVRAPRRCICHAALDQPAVRAHFGLLICLRQVSVRRFAAVERRLRTDTGARSGPLS
jgi:hypothetical protein